MEPPTCAASPALAGRSWPWAPGPGSECWVSPLRGAGAPHCQEIRVKKAAGSSREDDFPYNTSESYFGEAGFEFLLFSLFIPTHINPEIMAWEKKIDFGVRYTWMWVLSLSFVSCVPLDTLLDNSELPCLHPQNQHGCILGMSDAYKISYVCSLSFFNEKHCKMIHCIFSHAPLCCVHYICIYPMYIYIPNQMYQNLWVIFFFLVFKDFWDILNAFNFYLTLSLGATLSFHHNSHLWFSGGLKECLWVYWTPYQWEQLFLGTV